MGSGFVMPSSGPPGVRIEDAYVQLYPLNKHKCHEIDPVRDISYQLHNPLQPSQLQIGDDQALHQSHFNFSEPTVLFFHAFSNLLKPRRLQLSEQVRKTRYYLYQRIYKSQIPMNSSKLDTSRLFLLFGQGNFKRDACSIGGITDYYIKELKVSYKHSA
nr:unnamed protein product [Callosobruchus analis]